MMLSHLLDISNSDIQRLGEVVSSDWGNLRRLCPSLCKYESLESFLSSVSLKSLDSENQALYQEFAQQFKQSNNVVYLMILLFSEELRKIIFFVISLYNNHFILEELWSVISSEFIRVLLKYHKAFPPTSTVFKRTRNRTTILTRKAINQSSGQPYAKYVHRLTTETPLYAKDTQYETAVYNEMMEYYKSHLKMDEYKAITVKSYYELYYPGVTNKQLSIERNMSAEKRAVRKMRILFEKFYPKK